MSKSPASRIQEVIDALAAAQEIFPSPSEIDTGATCARDEWLAGMLSKQRLKLVALRDELESPTVRKQAIALSTEVLLDVVGCLNHDNIVFISLVGKSFRDLAEHYRNHCVAPRNMRITLSKSYFKVRAEVRDYHLDFCAELNCTDVLCGRIHIADALQKLRNIVDFDHVGRIETFAAYWTEQYLLCLSRNVPLLEKTPTLIIKTDSTLADKDSLMRCVEFFTSLERLTFSDTRTPLVRTPIAWDMVDRASFLRLQEDVLCIKPLDYRNPHASVVDEEAIVRYLTALATMGTPKTLRICGIALSEDAARIFYEIVNASTTLVSVEFETPVKLRPAGSIEIIKEKCAEYEVHRSDNESSNVFLVQYDSLRGIFYYFLTNDSAAVELPNLRALRYKLSF